jgi:hypothetical protein
MNSSLETFNSISIILKPDPDEKPKESNPSPSSNTSNLYNKDRPIYRKKPIKKIFNLKK